MIKNKWDVLVLAWFVMIGSLVIWSVMWALSDRAENNACKESGGVYVQTYDGYKCYSNDFRQVLTVK